MKGSPKTAEDTRRAVRHAMEIYGSQVLDDRYYHERSGIFRFPGRITAMAVLKLAGVRSRSTLRPEYHKELRQDLSEFIRGLKQKTGKDRCKKVLTVTEGIQESFIDRTERMAQAIAALEYEIMRRRATNNDRSAPETDQKGAPYSARGRRRTPSRERR